MTGELKHIPEELLYLPKLLSDKYFCNFSLFQSLPDSWAIDQIFPIIPIQRLDEKPERSATLQDITCDSDGKIDNFISTRNFSYYLPVHSLKSKETLINIGGIFGWGLPGNSGRPAQPVWRHKCRSYFGKRQRVQYRPELLMARQLPKFSTTVQYNAKKLVRTVETWVTTSVKSGIISAEEGKEFLSNYRSGLYGYTYLE